MKSTYISIVRKVMGDEAARRGYEIKSGNTRLATRTIAIFHRNKGEVSQSFYITEDLLHDGVLYLDCDNRIVSNFNDDKSFEDCIKYFNDYLLNDGYRRLDEAIETPIFSKADSNYVRDNNEELAKKFFEMKQQDLESLEFKDGLHTILISLSECLNDDWDYVKEQLLILAGALTFVFVTSEYHIYIKEKKNMTTFYLEREEGLNSIVSNSPLDLIYASYKVKSVEKIMVPILKRYFLKDELLKIGFWSKKDSQL